MQNAAIRMMVIIVPHDMMFSYPRLPTPPQARHALFCHSGALVWKMLWHESLVATQWS